MTYNETKTERKFKSEQHALMTAAIALLKYTQDGYLCSTYFMPSEQFTRKDKALFEVTIHHEYGEEITLCDYLTPSKIEIKNHEAEGEREAFGCTNLIYEYRA